MTLKIIFVIFVVFLLPCSLIQTSNFTYNGNDFVTGYTTIGTFADGTILFQVIFENTPKFTNLSLVHPDGTLNFINNVQIPCNSCENTIDDIYVPCLCMNKIYILNPNYILITYAPAEELMGMIIDRSGIVITSNFILGEAFSVYRIASESDDGRFLVVRQKEEIPNQLLCAEYIINSNGQISSVLSGNLIFNEIDGIGITEIITFDAFSLDGTWAIVFQVIFNQYEQDNDSFFSIIQSDSNQVLYDFKTIRLIDITYSQASVCVANKETSIHYHCLFVSSDSSKLKLININDLNSNNASSIDLFSFNGLSYNIISAIPDIGFLVEVKSDLQLDYLILNTEIDYSDTNNAFGELITKNYYTNDLNYYHLFILPNNTIIQMIINNASFSFLSSDISSIIPKNEPYNNTHINKVYPSQNDLIPIGFTELDISFVHSIDPITTAVNISVYLQHNNENLLRQKFLCANPNCVISDDSYSLKINLLNITFNIPNTAYYVEIDDNFVKYKYDGPKTIIPGIKPGNWIIKTSAKYNKNNDNTDFITGILRLNLEGTNEFKKLKDSNEKNDFFEKMRIELSKSIPVDQSRIRKIKNIFGVDKISNLELLLILFEIGPSNENNFNKKGSKEIFDDLNSLIKAKNVTISLDIYDHTKYIDKDYADLWEEIKISLRNLIKSAVLIVISGLIILSVILFIIGKCRDKDKEGTNIIILKVALIIVDIINDISFIITSKDDLHDLLIPSLLFLIFPFIMNTILTIKIFMYELKISDVFDEWFKKYSKRIVIITIFSSGDVELLHLFDSKFGRFDIFKIEFSSKSKHLISWGGYLNVILEDLPQLIIQILFAINFTSSYNIIALITLISSIVVLLVSIIEGGFHIYTETCRKKVSNNLTYNENISDFGYTSVGTYADGTILIQIIFQESNILNFRLIHPNGTITFIDNINIPCDLCPNINVGNAIYPCYLCTFAAYILNPNYILITYQQNQNTGNMGIIINWSGITTTSNFILGGQNDIIKIVSNNDGGKFLSVGYNYMITNQLSSTEYSINNDGQIIGMISGNLAFNDIDGTVVTVNNQIDIFSLNNTWVIVFMDINSDVFFSIIQAESNQALNVFRTLKLIGVAAYQKTVCISNKEIDTQYYCLFRNFDDKLKLFNINNLNYSLTDLFPFIDYYNNLNSIPNVGFLVELGTDLKSSLQTKYFVLNGEINYSDPINAFGEFITENYYINDSIYLFDRLFILPNNTMVQMVKNNNSLTFVSRDYLPSLQKVLYQQRDEENLLRQILLCTSPNCVISEDSYSLVINLLNVTFNIPDSSYYVEIGDNFVKYKNNYEGLIIPGIKPGNWIIKTTEYSKTNNDNKKFIVGRLRLNLEGTEDFKQLKDINMQNNFFINMTIGLAKSIPVDQSRILKIKNIYEFDKISNSELLLIFFQIGSSNENCFNKKSSKDVFDDLNSLIKADKDIITFLNINDFTRNIDKDYGFQKTTDLWEEIKINAEMEREIIELYLKLH
ncbi:hypothetical protein C1645_838654 [Glomus cerebriforme]|uniref:Uncharacterized protein n=1 Tax=Glomus cerebriforme TaxID=658196 RepID=A0A397S8Z1_9GLOM|nr:hypothetical protein C1645_838654 [Glomus cerebriforme]